MMTPRTMVVHFRVVAVRLACGACDARCEVVADAAPAWAAAHRIPRPLAFLVEVRGRRFWHPVRRG